MCKREQRVVTIRGVEYTLYQGAKLKGAQGKIIEARKGRRGTIHLTCQRANTALDTLIHELSHAAFPDIEESAIRRGATDIAQVLWALGYRKQQMV